MHKVKIRFAYKQGFRRIWLMISVAWLLFGIYSGWGDSHFWKEFFQFCLIPCVILYLFGMICVWVIEGFARADR